MCTGVAVMLEQVPVDFVSAMPGRVVEREGRRELQFHWWQTPGLLPVHWDGQLKALRWGSQDGRDRPTYGGWIAIEQLKSGALAHVRPEEVEIPAMLGFHKGTWYLVDEGIRGVVLPDVPGGPVVYMLTEPSTPYYRNMTGQSPFMPALIGQVI